MSIFSIRVQALIDDIANGNFTSIQGTTYYMSMSTRHQPHVEGSCSWGTLDGTFVFDSDYPEQKLAVTGTMLGM